ncbi:Retrovirus-related Pol polyprotein from transposon RE1, partial [Bienertia sinuspersici]
ETFGDQDHRHNQNQHNQQHFQNLLYYYQILNPDASFADELLAWDRCNALVCSWLLFNLGDDIAKSVMFLKTAQDIWNDLEDRFGFSSTAQIYAIEQKLAEITQGNQSISEFYTSIKSLWDSLDEIHPLPTCTCGGCTCGLSKRVLQRQQEKMLLQFIMKLAEQYAPIRGNILMMNPTPKVSEAYCIFAQEEKHKELSSLLTSKTESLAFVAQKKNFNHNTSYNTAKSQSFSSSSRHIPSFNTGKQQQQSYTSTFNKNSTPYKKPY